MPYSTPVARHRRVSFAMGLLMLAGTGCGAGKNDASPSGPDDASVRPVAAIAVVSGSGQRVGPGEVVPTSPLLRATSDRGRPLMGATLTFTPEGGRGTLDAASVVTDTNGEGRLPRWVAPLISGEFAVSVTATTQGSSSTANIRVTASVNDVATQVASQTLGPAGGVVTVASTASPLYGLTITVPAAALASSTTFTVASRPLTTTLPAGLSAASPLVDIAAGGTSSDSIIEVRLPALGSGAGTLRAFEVGANSELIPVPTMTSDNSSVTVAVRKFTTPASAAAIFRLSATESAASIQGLTLFLTRLIAPLTGSHSVPFAIGRDNAEFVNFGSFWAAAGYCAGSTVLAGSWFRGRAGIAQLTARAQFRPLLTKAETQNWPLADQLNPAIRLATALQTSYGPYANNIGWWKTRFRQSPSTAFANVAVQIYYSSQPVFIVIISADNQHGHALLAYAVDMDLERIYVSDPNYPENAARYIQYDGITRTFNAFLAAPNATPQTAVSYTQIYDASYFFLEEMSAIRATTDAYLADELKTRYPPVTGRMKLMSGQVVSANEDINPVTVESRDRQLRFVAANLGSGWVDWLSIAPSGGTTTARVAVGSNTDTVRINLMSGLNRIGMIVWKTNASGGGSWYDTKLLVVNRHQPVLKFLTQPANGREGAALPAVRIGLVDEDGNLVPESRPIVVTLQGGAAGAVLAGGGNVTTAADGSVTLAGLSVDKVGQGYTLLASSALLTAVTSTAFNVDVPGGTFSGRVYNAVTSNGISGASIVVRNGATQVGSALSTASGDWSVIGVPDGTYQIDFAKTGYISTSAASQTLTLPGTVVEAIPMVPTATPGGMSGSIKSATTTALVLSATTVELRPGVNALTGAITATLQTSNGTYAFSNIAAGVYTVVARSTGYANGSRTGVVVGAGQTASGQDVLLNPVLTGARIVLTWGATPNDLDSHLTGPITGTGSRFWVYYLSRGNCAAAPWACLDVDDTNGLGPETMTIAQLTPGLFRYYVYDYTNHTSATSTQLSLSGARVQFYFGSALVRTFFVPAGVGNAWSVFEWNSQTQALTVLNQLYTISGVPMPASVVGAWTPATAAEELRQLIQRLPAKPPR
jgi:hypothetical protein